MANSFCILQDVEICVLILFCSGFFEEKSMPSAGLLSFAQGGCNYCHSLAGVGGGGGGGPAPLPVKSSAFLLLLDFEFPTGSTPYGVSKYIK